jgi:hypothetical protein
MMGANFRNKVRRGDFSVFLIIGIKGSQVVSRVRKLFQNNNKKLELGKLFLISLLLIKDKAESDPKSTNPPKTPPNPKSRPNPNPLTLPTKNPTKDTP